MGMNTPPRLLLDAYAARTCAVKTHNRFDPRAVPASQVDPSTEETFDAGLEHRTAVIRRLAAVPGAVDLRDLDVDQPGATRACLVAMAEGAPVIIGGWLPLAEQGYRAGRPDLWVRGADTVEGRPGYLPVLVKNHQMQEMRRSGRSHQFRIAVSLLEDPSPTRALEVDSRAIRVSSREGDLLEAAHHWRMAQAHGLVPHGPALAGCIGTDEAADDCPVITWLPLGTPLIRTYSRSAEQGWVRRTALERYDHEYDFRVEVARTARLQGRAQAPPALVTPIVVKECTRCQWWETCRPQLDDQDLSLRIEKSPLDVREIAVLRRLGIETIDDLATVDLDELAARYLPQVQHRPRAENRLRLAARRARMLAAGQHLERLTQGPVEVPAAVVEVDFDIETSSQDRAYLWGFLVRDSRTGQQYYRHFSAFHDLDAEAEVALAEEAMGWLRDLVARVRADTSAASPHRAAVLVYHYSAYEVNQISTLAGRSGSALLRAAREWARDHFVDLFTVVRANFFGVHGLGLKAIATQGAGFQWRDDDPGGLNSQVWFDEAVHAEDEEERAAARVRVLEYNEDDVRATAALRDWLGTLS